MRVSMFVVSVLIACTAAAETPAGIDLANLHGWNIVVAPDAIASEVYAAGEFQKHLALAGGPKLPIVKAAKRPDRHIFIGPGTAMRASGVGFKIDNLGPEDLRIIVRNANIAIAGGRPRGTLYGVYTFLEDYLGVRFVTPDQTHVPPLGRWRKIGPVDRTYRPPMEWRWVAYEANFRNTDFATQRRQNASEIESVAPGSTDWSQLGKYGGRSSMHLVEHTFMHLLPPAKYANKHPEYYCLFKGKRWANVRYEDGRFHEDLQPCLMHPDVQRIMIQGALADLEARPKLKNVPVSQADGSVWCQCPRCEVVNKREDSKMGTILTLVNAVADEVTRKYPGRMVGTLAYAFSSKPPKNLRPRENVQIIWCGTRICLIHAMDDPKCPLNAAQLAELRQWSKLTPNLYVWYYNFNHDRRGFQLPLPNLRYAARNIRTMTSVGVKGIFVETCSSSRGNEFQGVRNYLLSRAIWNPALDGRQLINEWLDLYYGPAAPPIRRWLTRLHDRAEASGLHRRAMGGRYDEYGLDESDVRAGLKAVAEAKKLADSAVVRRRVEVASIWAIRATLEPVWYLQGDANVDPKLARRLRPYAKRFFDLCRKHGVRRTAARSHHTMAKQEKKLRGLLGKW